jgi:general secretion pathway protein N
MTRGRTWRGIIAGSGVVLGAYIAFLIALAPATLLDGPLRDASDGRLRLTQARGTLWSGDGQLEFRNRNGQRAAGMDLSWSLQPHALWHGRLDYAVVVDHAAKGFAVRLSPRWLELSDVDLRLPASVLGVAAPRLAPLGLKGHLIVHIAKFARRGDAVAADAMVTWKDASSAVTAIAPLGTYELRVNSAGAALQARLRTRSGPLHLDGSGSWRGGESPALAATARVDPRYHAQLAPLLRLVAVERGNGDFALQFNPPFAGAAARAPSITP